MTISSHSIFIILGRIFVALLFLLAFWANVNNWKALQAQLATHKYIPFPSLVLVVALIWQILGAIMILIGWHVKIAAISFIPFTCMAVFLYHEYWKHDGIIKQLHLIIFRTHLLATLGCLLLLSGIY